MRPIDTLEVMMHTADKRYVAFTRMEGRWPFTLSNTPDEAMDKLALAIEGRKVLSYPIGNPISAVVAVPNDLIEAHR